MFFLPVFSKVDIFNEILFASLKVEFLPARDILPEEFAPLHKVDPSQE